MNQITTGAKAQMMEYCYSVNMLLRFLFVRWIDVKMISDKDRFQVIGHIRGLVLGVAPWDDDMYRILTEKKFVRFGE